MSGSVLTTLRTGVWHLRRGGLRQVKSWNVRRRAERGLGPPATARGAEAGWTGRGKKRRLSFLPAALVPRPPRREDLTVGVILDDFSTLAFRYEFSTVALHPAKWKQQLAETPLDLIFVESAWAGNHGLWRGKLAGPNGPGEQFSELMSFCREQEIPTVFWNKEDPPHYADFLPAARLFEHVFTSDENRVEHYRRDLGHNNVAVLPFAAQPAIHNPLRPRSGWHGRDVAFAGMYFAHKYPERREQMDLLLGGAADASGRMRTGLEIFSRQLGGEPNYQFPAPLDARVVGSLSYKQMLTAYKAYKVFLNVNSVVDSPSMCARRIFEIVASGTPVISAPSIAVENFFSANEVLVANTRAEATRLSRALVQSPEFNDRTVHLAQRRIWQSHTYAHRAEAVLQAALPERATDLHRPTVSALVSTNRPHRVDSVFATLAAQRGMVPQLVLLTHGFELQPGQLTDLRSRYQLENVVVLHAPTAVSLGECLNQCVSAADGDVLTKMDDDDHYGSEYLSDQLYALDYAGADVVGKQAHYMYLEERNASLLRFAEREHRFTDRVMGPTIMAGRLAMKANPFPNVGIGEDTGFLRSATQAGMQIYSADRFNYYQHRSVSGHTWDPAELELLSSGSLKFYGKPDQHVDI